MKNHKKSFLVLTIVMAFVVTALFLPNLIGAGDLEPPGAPGATMHTLEEIYQKLEAVDAKIDPIPPASVPKSGQSTSYVPGDDGDIEAGVPWPNPRFTDNGNGTVKDNLTGLIWLKNANCFGLRSWTTALTDCNTLNSDECGLSDGSAEGDWHLPNRKELESLIDLGHTTPALPSGHPFTGVQSFYYWSGTTYADSTDYAWYVYMGNGGVGGSDKTHSYRVWPVRGGND